MFRDLLGSSEDLYQYRRELKVLVSGFVDAEQILAEGQIWKWQKKYKSQVKPGDDSVDPEVEVSWERLWLMPWRGQLAMARQIGNVDEPESRDVDAIVFGEGGQMIIFSTRFSLARENRFRQFDFEGVCVPEVWGIDRQVEVIKAMESSLLVREPGPDTSSLVESNKTTPGV